jgi:hypothetical protein
MKEALPLKAIILGRCPRLVVNAAPLALEKYL